MNIEKRCEALGKLGDWLKAPENTATLEALYYRTAAENNWFLQKESGFVIAQIADSFLNREALQKWVAAYPVLAKESAQKAVGLVLAGNIPAVGFHDVLCTFVAGYKALIKFSDKDKVLIPFLIEKLKELEPETAPYFEVIERLRDVDMVIATGSDNSARYFERYFEKTPHIIRGNRNSVAVLHGDENAEDLAALGGDIFRYFGLGCRSVSKIYVPKDFKLEYFMEQMDLFSDEVLVNFKYKNNYDYNRSVYLLNGTVHWCNDSLILMEEQSLLSRIATLHFEYYASENELVAKLGELQSKIQCIVSKYPIPGMNTLPLGQSQLPNLNDYADGVDTMAFLLSIE